MDVTTQEDFYSILPHGLRDRLDVEGWGIPDSKAARVVRDLEVAAPVLELTAQSGAISFPGHPDSNLFIGTTLPVLNLQMKNMGRKCGIEVLLATESGSVATITCSNTVSVARVQADSMTIPLKLVASWNKIVLDLDVLTRQAWGNKCEYKHAIRVSIFPCCRLRRVFFSSNICKNRDLPPSLRLTLASKAKAAGAPDAGAAAAESKAASAAGAGSAGAAAEATGSADPVAIWQNPPEM